MTQDPIPSSQNEDLSKPSLPVWFWIVAVVSLLWYLMDTSAFAMRLSLTDDIIATMPENQQHLYRNMPVWVNAVFGIEAVGGLLGSLALLVRRKSALPLFVMSILGVIAQTSHIWFNSDAVSTMGAPAIVMPLVAIIIGALMILLTKSANAKGWLR